MIRLVIADDHLLVRRGLTSVLASEKDMSVLTEASSPEEVLAAMQLHGAGPLHPDVLLLDLSMGGRLVFDVIAKVRASWPKTRVLVLSMHEDPALIRRSLTSGAYGFIVKGTGLSEMLAAIRRVAQGRRYVAPPNDSLLLETPAKGIALERQGSIEQLTSREREVLKGVAEGKTNREIAAALRISPKTVDTHRTSLMRKLDLHDAQALTRFAIRHGLIES